MLFSPLLNDFLSDILSDILSTLSPSRRTSNREEILWQNAILSERRNPASQYQLLPDSLKERWRTIRRSRRFSFNRWYDTIVA